MSEPEFKKVQFKYYSDVLEEQTVENMWAKVIDHGKGIFELDTIPFYGPPIAPGDLFIARLDESGESLEFIETIKFSNNSVVQILVTNSEMEINSIRDQFKDLNCTSERIGDSFFAMEIPKSVDYSKIQKKLEELVNSEFIEYAEPCLSEKHQNDISSN